MGRQGKKKSQAKRKTGKPETSSSSDDIATEHQAPPSPWTRDKAKRHKHSGAHCPSCLVYRMAVAAENLLSKPFSPSYGADAKAIGQHLSLGSEEILKRWNAFLEQSKNDQFTGNNRTITYFASHINAGWSANAHGRGASGGYSVQDAATQRRAEKAAREYPEPTGRIPIL